MKSTVWCVMVVILWPFMLLGQMENWVYRYELGSIANSVVYGTDGNIYAGGYQWATAAIVVSLTAAGDTNWTYRYGWDAHGRINGIVYGVDGNIYAGGCTGGSNRDDDFAVFSLTAGDTNWVYRYDAGGYDDVANSIVYGADGNIYAVGYNTNSDFLVISLTTAGDTSWVYTYDGPGHYADEANSVAYGADGNIYVAGASYGNGGIWDFLVISLTTSGDTNWVYRYDGPGHFIDEANSLVYGTDGNIYVAGTSFGSGGNGDFLVISLTTSGDTNWVYRYDGPGPLNDGANSLVYGADGNIYAAGYTFSSGTLNDCIVISLTAAGDTNWVYQYDGLCNGDDRALSIVYGADGNIYVAGSSQSTGVHDDFLVISLTTSGDTNWVYKYDGPGHFNDGANSLVYGADGNIYAGGYSWDTDMDADFIVISLPSDLGVKENKIAIVNGYDFGTTIFRGPLQLPEGKKCRVFDITGRVVEPTKIQSGIYFIEVDGVVTQKVVKIR